MKTRFARFSLATVIALILVIGTVSVVLAFTQSSFISFTLEGCRNDGTITLPIGGKFVCPDAPYTTGNLGKGWNELDLVPHRLTTSAGNQGGVTTDYSVYIAADYQTSGKTGYDVISAPEVNTAKSDASCTVSAGPQSTQGSAGNPFGGGTDVVIYRELTIHQDPGTTCVFDYYQRLALGSHLYPGSSLQSYMFDQAGLTGSKKTISIPVNEIKPQSLSKDMSATQDTDHVWDITKSPTPATLSFGNTCDASQPTSKGVQIKVEWTKEAADPSGPITVITHVYATNPSARAITTNVTDVIYSGTTALFSATASAVVPANTANALLLTHITSVPAGTTDLNDIATGTYTDTVTNIPIPGTTTATASAAVQPSGIDLNASAVINDVETMTGSGLTFSADSFTPLIGAFDNGYVAGTQTLGPVSWTSTSQGNSGSVTFNKTVYVGGPSQTSGTLSDTATLTGSDGFTTNAQATVDVSADARVSLTINKSITPALTSGSQTFTFHVKNSSNVEVAAPIITFNAGDTSKSVTVNDLAPGSYTVTEDAVPGWVTDSAKSTTINLPTCSGSVSFANAQRGTIIVKKVTDPAGALGTFNFSGDVSGSIGDGGTLTVSNLAPGTYTSTEANPAPAFDLTSISCDDGASPTPSSGSLATRTATFKLDPGETVTCTFTNRERGFAKVIKTVNGAPPSGTQTFIFQLRSGASLASAGTILETGTANAANGGAISFSTYLVPGATYQLCEQTLPGWMTSLGPPLFAVYNPSGDNSVVCTDFTVTAGQTLTFNIDNTPPPGGRALTIGFWKNWASCANSNGKGQKPILDQTLAAATAMTTNPPGGLVVSAQNPGGGWPNFAATYYLVLKGNPSAPNTAPDCAKAVNLLNKSTIDGKTKKASDPLFNMAAQLVGAQLNFFAGAGKNGTMVANVQRAVLLLGKYQFNGNTYSPKLNSADTSTANCLATQLDNYNNNRTVSTCP